MSTEQGKPTGNAPRVGRRTVLRAALLALGGAFALETLYIWQHIQALACNLRLVVALAVPNCGTTIPALTPQRRTPLNGSASEIRVVMSSLAGDRLTVKPSLKFGPAATPRDALVFTIDDSVGFQTIVGFGASFNEAGLVALNALDSPALQESVLRSLFDPTSGAGFSAMKTPIAGTDFMSATQQWYSYDDTPGDTALQHFSIARDLGPDGLITYIKRARAAGGKFLLEAPMDYPPDWMLVDVQSNQDVKPRYYDALARYYVRYLTAYEDAGVHIDYLSLFNELGGYTKITMCELKTLIRDHVGPALQASAARSTGLMVSEVANRGLAGSAYPIILSDPAARAYISVVGYHGYGDPDFAAIASLYQKYPGLPLWMTEICCMVNQGEGIRFESGDLWANIIMSDLEVGASAWIYWNAILDQNGGPWLVSTVHNDPVQNAQNSVVVINTQQQSVTYTGLYYYLTHFSKFVRPGAVRVSTQPSQIGGVRCITFESVDRSMVSELLNSSPVAVTVSVSWHGKSVDLTLPAVSITTLRWTVQS
jgi:O-glycosyl hydrolase